MAAEMTPNKRLVYMDHAATTPLDPRVLDVMLPYLREEFGNPSGLYGVAREAQKAVNGARRVVADVLGCSPEEVVFTSGGTESDNTALKGAASALREKGNHVVTSAVEHHAVLQTCRFLERHGYDGTYLPVDSYGMVSPDDLERAVTDRTILVSIMLANNEIGTVQPVAECARVVRERAGGRDIVFHTDAVQCVGALDLDVEKLGVDMLSLSAHKFYGPRGAGVLYVRNMTPFLPQQAGGGQEMGRRAGTENVAGIVGTATALKLAAEERESNSRRCRTLRDRLIEGLMSRAEGARLNGHPEKRLPNNVNMSFRYVDGEAIVVNLDIAGVAASSGSACASGAEDPSHVLLATRMPREMAYGSLRLTLGTGNTDDDVDYVLSVLPDILRRLQSISPLAAAAEKPGEKDV
jgi:cysteine desulfurase